MFLRPGSRAPGEGTFDTELTTSRTPLQRMLQFLLNGNALVQTISESEWLSCRSRGFYSLAKPCACARAHARKGRYWSRRKDCCADGQHLVPTTAFFIPFYHWGQPYHHCIYISWVMKSRTPTVATHSFTYKKVFPFPCVSSIYRCFAAFLPSLYNLPFSAFLLNTGSH